MKTILVIEDEAQTRTVFLKCLEFEGFQALGDSTGSAGIQLAQQHCPHLIVCDIMMPDIDGYSVLSTLRRSPRTAKIPVIFLTAKVTMADLRRGMELGADDYLTKPCTIERFLAAITTRLHRYQELLKVTVGEASLSLATGSPATAEHSPSHIFPDCPKLADVFRYLEAHYRDTIRLEDVAQAVGYSAAYLTNLVQAQTGLTIKRWIIERRMAQARHLLTTSSESVGRIAELSGYSDAGYFTRQFRQFHGVSPKVWRQQSMPEVVAQNSS